MEASKFRPFTVEEVEITVHAEESDVPIKGSFCGTTEWETQAMERDAIDAAAQSVWGWANITVFAERADLVGTNHLGGCSYKDEADFKSCPYYADMVKEALADLNSQAEKLHDTLMARAGLVKNATG